MDSQRSLKGTRNVLVDLGFEDAEDLTAKASLAVKLNDLVQKRGLSQRRFKLQSISLEHLMQALATLDQWVKFVLGPARRAQGPGVTVAV